MLYHLLKRTIDLASSTIGLTITLPFWPVIALAIKLDSRGSVMVKLDRVSVGKIIKVYKFRSMVAGSHSLKPHMIHLNERRDGPFFKIKNDPRITRVGKILRKFRIDELPQIINVLKGEMSLVGPRPHEPNEVIYYPGQHKHLILAKSGVTGLSQVNGASSLPFLKELELDGHYVKNLSFWLDAKIILKTAKILFSDPTAV